MGVKLWMRNFAQQNLNRFPPANGGYAGERDCGQKKEKEDAQSNRASFFSLVVSLNLFDLLLIHVLECFHSLLLFC